MNRVFTIFSMLLPLSVFGQYLSEPVTVFHDPDVDLATSISAADLNGDGLEDLLMCSADMNVFYLKNEGEGVYSEPILIFNSEVFGEDAEASDVDGDGDLDVIAITDFEDKVLWVENIGDGQFGAAKIIDDELDSIDDLTLADVDNDGDLDVFISTYSTSTEIGKIIMYLNENGGFSERFTIVDEISNTKQLIVADFDGNGTKDILIGTFFDNMLAWGSNNLNGTFGPEVIIDADASVKSVSAGDLDGDGDIDLVVAGTFDIDLYFNDGTGSFSPKVELSSNSITALHLVDLNQDGLLDIVGSSLLDRNIEVYINEGEGNFLLPVSSGADMGNIKRISSGDMDNDGDLDVLTVAIVEDTYSFFENISGTTSTMEIESATVLEVRPNPSSGQISVFLEGQIIDKITIYDMVGNIRFDKRGIKSHSVSLSTGLSAGMYNISVKNVDGGVTNQRIIIAM